MSNSGSDRFPARGKELRTRRSTTVTRWSASKLAETLQIAPLAIEPARTLSCGIGIKQTSVDT